MEGNMGYLKERVSYIKGLAEGMQISETTNEGKILHALIETMDDFATTVETIEEAQENIYEEMDELHDVLSVIKEDILDDDFDDECEKFILCPSCNKEMDLEELDFEDDTGVVECPHCHEEVEVEWECSCGEFEDEKED
jgi:hypothetical protein